jgi:hypothetical protein
VPTIIPSLVSGAHHGRRVVAEGRPRHPRQAEVEQLHAALRDHDVARLQIAMDDALPVRAVERRGDVDGDAQRALERQRAARDQAGQRLALEQLHDQIRRRPFAADVVERADVRMIQRRDRARLALEARAQVLALGDALRQDFDRYLPVEARVARAVDLAHAAGAEARQHFVWSQSGPRLHGQPSSSRTGGVMRS